MDNASDLNLVVDVIVPVVFVIVLCVINVFVVCYIIRRRKEYQDLTDRSRVAAGAAAAYDAPTTSSGHPARADEDIEMERL
ncbi:uncharacterized protein LOC116805929 [Drosophila grimshawi]|uniref:uncharacterized protein LOC116805929 n=1 Tax=Drosophila grimshawi TaxID=7222 RepID=UPI0013EF0143|nr:uncharacterized protein LOC116805929 [Drosophila grimshawi]